MRRYTHRGTGLVVVEELGGVSGGEQAAVDGLNVSMRFAT